MQRAKSSDTPTHIAPPDEGAVNVASFDDNVHMFLLASPAPSTEKRASGIEHSPTVVRTCVAAPTVTSM